jgi:F-type H+/Na+-transporting ATPase subunit beta
MAQNVGKVAQIIGPVVDITFPSGTKLPNILDAVAVKRPGGDLIMECQQHIGEDTIRAIAMDATEGLQRGTEVHALGSTITMPTGDKIKGRLLELPLMESVR